MAIVKQHVSVMDSPTAPVFTDRMIVGQQIGLAAAATVVVTFNEPLPTTYSVMVGSFNTTGITSWFISAKTAFGFTVNLGGAPAGTFDVLVVAA